MPITHVSSLSGRGRDPLSTSWLTSPVNAALGTPIYPPTIPDDDSSMYLAMTDYFFGADAPPVQYRILRGPRVLARGPRPMRGPRVRGY